MDQNEGKMHLKLLGTFKPKLAWSPCSSARRIILHYAAAAVRNGIDTMSPVLDGFSLSVAKHISYIQWSRKDFEKFIVNLKRQKFLGHSVL